MQLLPENHGTAFVGDGASQVRVPQNAEPCKLISQ